MISSRDIYYLKNQDGEWRSGTIISTGGANIVSFAEDNAVNLFAYRYIRSWPSLSILRSAKHLGKLVHKFLLLPSPASAFTVQVLDLHFMFAVALCLGNLLTGC